MLNPKTFGHFLWLVRKTWITRGPRLYYSQFGEDAVLREIISPRCNKGVYVDVGAYHPTRGDDTSAMRIPLPPFLAWDRLTMRSESANRAAVLRGRTEGARG
ncbi:hypothetical protein HDG38_003767 [Paraburkholderia sp. WSM4177]|nr:hypothetical protein [Paraburkholderia sp. WSM4177]MBB5485686.1 hypothetical protein [Paraburkholderia sp. WSM4180]